MYKVWNNSTLSWPFVMMILFAQCSSAQEPLQPIDWHPWSDAIFSQAARDHKFVLLEMEATWCHWCHVMDRQTFTDPAVSRLMGDKYIAVRVDQESRPDIANRYEDYGPLATIIFNANGSEIVREQGFLPPRQMASLLRAVIDDPSPGPSAAPEPAITYAPTPFFPPGLLAEVNQRFESQYDVPGQGWAFGLKYLDVDSAEYARVLAQSGDRVAEQRFRDILQAAQKLIDPVWGGVYQSLVIPVGSINRYPVARYFRVQIAGRPDSNGDNWNEPHFEKLLITQAQAIQSFAESYGQYHSSEYLATAQNVHRYVSSFLTSPDGAFYASQDADPPEEESSQVDPSPDDAKRRTLNPAQVDKHLYARENGWMVRALCTLYAVTGDATTLQEAERSAAWVITHRSLKDGGFSHDERDSAGPYLGDTLAVGQALLALYEVTADRKWLKRAKAATQFLFANFADDSGAGFDTSKTPTNRGYKRHAERDENAQVAVFANLLAQFTGDEADEEIAKRAMRYLATREIATAGLSAPILVAEKQFTHPAVHITVVGKKKDPAAQALYRTALGSGILYKRVEWWDSTEGPPSRSDVSYPQLTHAAAFICSASKCSSPIFNPRDLEPLMTGAAEHNK